MVYWSKIRKRIRDRYKMYTQELEDNFGTTMVLTVFMVVFFAQFVLIPYRLEQWERERQAEERYCQEMQALLKVFDEMEK